MHSINPDIASNMVQKTINDAVEQTACQNHRHKNNYTPVTDGGAYNFAPGMISNSAKFDAAMGKVANFKDMMFTAQDTMSLMRAQGESLLKLMNRAHEEECTQEELDGMNKEAASIVEEINKLFQNAEFNGINPLQTPFNLSIPNWQDFMEQFGIVQPQAAEGEEGEDGETQNAITNVLADIDFNFDMSADFGGSSLTMAASANIQIGFTDDGALQINVDASLDFDLSGVIEKGIESDDSMDLVNNFLNLLDGKQSDINSASSFLDSILRQVGISLDDFIQDDEPTSSHIQGQIVQQASITLANCANQIPSIAINLL